MSAADVSSVGAAGASKGNTSNAFNKLRAKRPSKRLQEMRRSGGDTFNYHRSAIVARPDSVDVDSVYEDTNDLMTRFTNNLRRYSQKNSHKPRGRYGRGLAKKNGAGGMYTWGVAGSEFAGQPGVHGADPAIDNTDPLDPNYDSESEDNCKLEAITPPMGEDEIENYVTPIIVEYFDHGDSEEVAILMEEVNLANNYHLILVHAVRLAIERKASQREMASSFISDMFGRLFTMEDVEAGFNMLVEQLTELELDTPDAASILGCFIARAVADDCLAPIYVYQNKEKYQLSSSSSTSSSPVTPSLTGSQSDGHGHGNQGHVDLNDDVLMTAPGKLTDCNDVDIKTKDRNGIEDYSDNQIPDEIKDLQLEKLARKTFTHAHALITKKGGLVQLDTVWGITGSARPVNYLIKQIRLILKEYLVSMDASEAARALRELEVPHFNHEFVYEAVLMAMEDNNKPHEQAAIARLLKSMSDINLLSVDQMKKGFLRIFDQMPEINIDVPLAYQYLEKLIQQCFNEKLFLPREIVDNVPSKGRKRFVSEGDGGRIKE